MYFCPCSCDDPIDPETEENSFFTLPRNLSYVQDSYLDRYSVSARFVHNPKIERCIQHQQDREWKANVEAETLGLLSTITAQELSGRCDGGFDTLSSSTFDFSRVDTSPSEAVVSSSSGHFTAGWSEGQSSSSCFTASSFFHPASVVASKISAFLHSPPNESMASARDIGTSVDGDSLPLMSEASAKVGPLFVECSRYSGDDMDRDSVLENCASHTVLRSSPTELAGQVVGTTVKGEHDNNFEDSEIAISSGNFDDDLLDDTDSNSSDAHSVPRTNMQEIYNAKENPVFTSSFESNDFWSQKPDHIGEKIRFPTKNTSSDSENQEMMSESNSQFRSLRDPSLTPLNVSRKDNFSEGDITSRMYEDGSCGNVLSIGVSALCGSPDSDAFSEEGVFVNTDDLDSTHEKSTTVSDASDDTFISADSMFMSPDEGELEDEDDSGKEPVGKMSIQEAISRAASDLNKISLGIYGSSHSTSLSSITTSNSSLSDAGTDLRFPPRIEKSPGRSSPVRTHPGLKIQIDESCLGSQSLLTDSSLTLTESPVYPDEEFNFSRVQLRKSSSLKSNKTPPGTPHRKKVVRFADAMGLDLESVRHVLNMESPPKIPASALADLMRGLEEDNSEVGSKYLCPCFSQPGAAGNFITRILNQKVCLENAIINDLTITGFVRVANIAFHKAVRIRYTHNGWSSFYDIAASYVQNSCDGPTDRFSFSIVAPPYFGPGSRLEFAVCYIAEGVEYWDNNEGRNYIFECFAKSIPMDSETAWLHFL
ncbi:unnamed protein product [Candidula unifasciata]|uniref:CBM21 domain-containing protein n=1 Tax=Candidula unifasciata TaxID=100452 RepID=A0A8S3YFA4_9EUPU|nr:unnamed protein product [Candidula unifasciata]